MAKEVGSRELAAAGGVASNKALDELLKKKALLAEADQAKSEQNEGEQAAAGEQASAEGEQVAAADGASIFAEGQYEVASAGAVAADAGGSSGLPTNTLLIAGGAALVGGAALALSSDDDGDTTVVNPGDGNVDPNPNVNDAPNIQIGNNAVNTNALIDTLVAGATAVSAVTVTDPENDAVTTTLTGTNAALFKFENGALSFKDAAVAGSYTVTINANDGALTTSVTVTVIVDAATSGGVATGGADTYELTDNIAPDNINLLGGDDTFNASVGDLNNQDQITGGDGNDTLNVVMSGGENEKPTITSVETINIESLGGTPNTLNLDNVNGTTTINVIDQGDNSGDLAIRALVNGTTRVNLTGDEAISLFVRDSVPANNAVNTGVNGFTGDLILGNAIENVSIEGNGAASNFDLIDNGGALEKVTVTGAADVTINAFTSTIFDYTANTGDSVLNVMVTGDERTVLMGSGDNVINFGNFLSHSPDQDTVDGGAGVDTLVADIGNGVSVRPVVDAVELVSLSFFDNGANTNGLFNAINVSDAPDYEIRASNAYVNLNNLENGSNIFIVDDVTGGDGSTFSFRDDESTTKITFSTVSEELTDIIHEGDVEVEDVKNLTVAVDGQGAVEIFGSIALDEGSSLFSDPVTTDLLITTNSEDDDDTDNDGDLIVDAGYLGAAISQASDLQNLAIHAVNGNITMGDGEVTESYSLINSPFSLETIDFVADNATLSVGDIGGFLAGFGVTASALETVDIEGLNRGNFNIDNINGGVVVGTGGLQAVLGLNNLELADIGLQGADIKEFNVTTAFRSETNGQFTDGTIPFGYNQIDDIVARSIEEMTLDVAEFGRLQIGDVYASLVEVTIVGEGRLDLYNNNHFEVDGAADITAAATSSEPADEGILPIYNDSIFLGFVQDVDATGHSGDIELDFRTFNGLNINLVSGQITQIIDSGVVEGLFDANVAVDASVELGDQDTIDNGIRFDSYGLINVTESSFTLVGEDEITEDLDVPSVTVIAGNGDHLFVGDATDNTNGTQNFSQLLAPGIDTASNGNFDLGGHALYGVDLTDDDFESTYGIVTGFGDDTIITGSGSSTVFGGWGDDTLSLGGGADMARGGYGHDAIDLGADSAADIVQFVGGFEPNDVSTTGESLGVNWDIVTNFKSGQDTIQLWNFGYLDGGFTDADDASVDQIDANDVGSLPYHVSIPDDSPIAHIYELVGERGNDNYSKAGLTNEQIENDFISNWTVNLEADTASDFFVIAWDQEGDDAALFFVHSDGTGAITQEQIDLVAVFAGVSEGGFSSSDFSFHQADYTSPF